VYMTLAKTGVAPLGALRNGGLWEIGEGLPKVHQGCAAT